MECWNKFSIAKYVPNIGSAEVTYIEPMMEKSCSVLTMENDKNLCKFKI